MLSVLCSKFKQNESFQKRINITNFEENEEEIGMDDDDVLIFKDESESQFFQFIKQVIAILIVDDFVGPTDTL